MKSTLGVSTWSLQQLTYTQGADLKDIIRMAAEIGAEGIDICEEYIPCHPQPDLVKMREIREFVEENNLKTGPCWFNTEIGSAIKADSEERALEVYKKNIIIAKEMGAEFICIPMLPNLGETTYEQRREQFIHFFEKLLPFAEKYDMPVSHECAREKGNGMALEIARYLNSRYYTICPDLEAWRIDTPDLPLGAHCEDPSAGKPTPEPIELFEECLPYSPYIHFKLLSLDENGEEPHFPIPQMMEMINNSPIDHYLCVEYEGWIPDIHPERDSLAETKRCIELIRRYQK